jgi:type IV pilus assembly protein PilQ
MNRTRAYCLTAVTLALIMLGSLPLNPLPTPLLLGAVLPQSEAQPQRAASHLDPSSTVGRSSGGALPAPTGPQYTGERISLNLKDVDIKDFFRLIHEISGLNVIVDPNVSGTLTLALDDVPWDQALDIVLRNSSLDKALDGNVLRIAKIDTLAAEADTRTKLARAQADAAGLVTVVRYLQYATAADVLVNSANVSPAQTGNTGAATGGGVLGSNIIFGVATVLKNLGRSILSPRGIIAADQRDNAVVITDIPSQIPAIEAIIDKLDRKSKQVSISARIVLTTSDVVHQIQSALNGQILNHSGSVSAGGATGSGASASAQSTPAAGTGASGRTTVTQAAASGFGAFAISNLGGLYAINAAISAAETKNLAKTISAPTIVTQNNVPGLVQQGTQLFIQTVINNTVTSVPINASLALAVTPQVTDDGHIFLNIQVQNDSPGPVLANTQNPEINIESATTQVVVPDGGVVVFGGIKLTSNTKTISQVPGLSSIPVFGNLFKSTMREDQENELVFIVTPKILPG